MIGYFKCKSCGGKTRRPIHPHKHRYSGRGLLEHIHPDELQCGVCGSYETEFIGGARDGSD